ncbi:DEAD/DEAH box helicase [Aminomonas paucivorans]|uniref:DEAD/DEAH box helicase n=1 Tax=Aminomonas paucivorans TaxID=81412 RepID=UPI001E5CB19E|nr:DEAD/DEAH box helicase [Aminomonas paucivorans]
MVDAVARVEGASRDLVAQMVALASAPNPAYVSAARAGRWTGGIPETLCLAREVGDTLLLPRGLVGRLLREAKDRGLDVDLVDHRLLLQGLGLTFKGTLREYQENALRQVGGRSQGVLVAPCGAGKTALLGALVAKRRQPAIVLCHTRDLAFQLREDLGRWLGVHVGLVGAGEYSPGGVVDVALLQSLRDPERLGDLTGRYGLVAVDECHHVPAMTFGEVVGAFPAVYRYGLSATPTRADGLTPLLHAVLGPTLARIEAEDLEDEGVRVRPALRWLRGLPVPGFDPEDWSRSVSRLARSEPRNRLIVGEAAGLLGEGRALLILASRKEQADVLAAGLREKGYGAEALHGGRTKADRERILEDLKGGSLRCVVSVNLADEGLNVPVLDALLLTAPTKNPGLLEQRVGRILRALPGKAVPLVVDLVDGCGVLEYQARSRFFSVYRALCGGGTEQTEVERGRQS